VDARAFPSRRLVGGQAVEEHAERFGELEHPFAAGRLGERRRRQGGAVVGEHGRRGCAAGRQLGVYRDGHGPVLLCGMGS